MIKSLLSILVTILIAGHTFSQADSTLLVGVKHSPPFIIKSDNGNYTGISIALWESIAADLGVQYEYREYDLQHLLDAVRNKEVDLSINPLTVTSHRAEELSFTQPFYITNLSIATNKKSENELFLFIKKFFSWEFFASVFLLVVVLLIFGMMVWVFERKKNQEEFGSGIKGIGHALWWSAVTMTTVGYGDKTPRTLGGRIVALIWMFTAIIIISGFTASIASSLTVNSLETSIKSPRDLKKVNTVTVQASSGAEYLENRNIDHFTVGTLKEGLEKLSNENADAIVYDEPLLRYMINSQNLDNKLAIIPNKFFIQYYSFALPKHSQWEEIINPILLDKINGVAWKATLSEFGLEED